LRKHKKRVLLIGLDAATFDVMAPMLASGKLPNLESLMEGGSSGVLLSTIPDLSPVAWSSFATGKNAGKHGIFSFVVSKPQSYEISLANGGLRQAEAFWRILSRRGRKVGVVNMPFSYPPEEVNGYFVCGMDAPGTSSDYTYPRELKSEIKELLGDYTIDYSFVGSLKRENREEILRRLFEAEKKRLELSLHLMRRFDWDLFFVVFVALDRVQHFFWHLMEPDHPLYHEPGGEAFREAIPEMYVRMDQLVGRLLEAIDEDTYVVVMSDHGAGPFDNSVPYLNLNDFFIDKGYLSLKSGRAKGGIASLLRETRSLLRKHLSPKMKERLKTLLPGAREWTQSFTYFSGIDWERTKAYATYDEIMSRGIRLNLKGREPQGIVNPQEEYESFREELVRTLSQLEHPLTNLPIVDRVYRREELYHGECFEQAPDLFVFWNDHAYFCGNALTDKSKYREVEGLGKQFKLTEIERSGDHRRNGILIVRGTAVRSKFRFSAADITDVVPTIFYLLGEPVPEDMDGKVLTNIIAADHLLNYPVSFSAEKGEVKGPFPEQAYTAEEAEVVEKHLRNLGYLD
jgi:predicted AlkP superfamily phosphohydrolase/phosphomutase